MCVICEGNYDINMTELNCDGCKDIKEIPFLPNLRELFCYETKIKEIPFLPNLYTLYCNFTEIKEIPLLPKLCILYCYSTEIKEIPLLPKLCILRCDIGYFNNFISINPFNINPFNINHKPIKHYYKIQTLKRKLLHLHRLNKKWNILWEIAEYYTAKNYHPDNLTEDYILTNF